MQITFLKRTLSWASIGDYEIVCSGSKSFDDFLCLHWKQLHLSFIIWQNAFKWINVSHLLNVINLSLQYRIRLINFKFLVVLREVWAGYKVNVIVELYVVRLISKCAHIFWCYVNGHRDLVKDYVILCLVSTTFFTNYAFRNSLSHNNTPIPRLYECVRRDVMGCLVTMWVRVSNLLH